MSQREIRFRSWDKKYNVMRPFNCVTVFGNGTFEVDRLDSKGHPIECCESASGELELMQFTGLRDKNGKEIYEGDVLQPVRYSKVDWLRGEVRFDNGMFYIHSKRHSGRSLHVSLSQADRAANSYQVIGNIYENPELLDP